MSPDFSKLNELYEIIGANDSILNVLYDQLSKRWTVSIMSVRKEICVAGNDYNFNYIIDVLVKDCQEVLCKRTDSH